MRGGVGKYADYFRTHRWYAIPGCDLHGNIKMHSSIAFLYDRPRVWFEAFHSTGWGGTIADTFDWMLPALRGGATLFNPHAVYYSTKKGWWEWAPPSTCWRQPYAMHYQHFANGIARLMKLLTQGRQQATIGLLLPTSTVQSAMGAEQSFTDADPVDAALLRLNGSMRWHKSGAGLLDELAIDYHIVDEGSLATAFIERGTATVKDVPLKAIILPHVTMMLPETAGALRTFAESGGLVLAVGGKIISLTHGALLDLASLPNAIVVASPDDLAPLLRGLSREIVSPLPYLHRRLDDLHVLFVPACLGMTTKVSYKDWYASLETAASNPGAYAKVIEIGLPADAATVIRFDPVLNRVEPLATTASSNGRQLRLDFGGAPFAVLVWSKAMADPDATLRPLRGEQFHLALSDSWHAEYVPTLLDVTDAYDPHQPQRAWPHTAELLWSQGDSEASAVRAGFGVHGHATTGEGEQPIVYSPRYGIAQDSIFLPLLGPKGHVPEEFCDLGKRSAGETVTIHTGVVAPHALDAVLAIGANARRHVRLNEDEFAHEAEQYLSMTPVRMHAGENALTITLTADRDGRLRAFWCFLRPNRESAFRRPERLLPGDGSMPASRVAFCKSFVAKRALKSGRLRISVGAMASVYVDKQCLGRQGGFDP